MTPSGIDVSPFYVLEYPDLVSVVATDEQDRVALVRQYRHGVGEVCLELPGGLMDEGEADPIAAARRELLEETGLTAGEFRNIVTLTVNPANFSNRSHVVAATGVKPGPRVHDPREPTEVVMVPREDALALARSGAVVNAQHVGMLFLALS